MWNIKISIDTVDVLGTGTIVCPSVAPINLYPLPTPFEGYRVECVFLTDPQKQPELSFVAVKDGHFKISFVNFNSGIGNATSVPIYVANHNGKKILFNAASYMLGSHPTGTRVFHYTFVDGGPVVG
jgi:hypothetical protein